MAGVKAPRGAPDLVPPDSELLTEVEDAARSLFDRYGYRRIETPLFESTDIFQRAAECIGSAEPIVDAELIVLASQFFDAVGLQPQLMLNSMGDPADRERYFPVLREALGDKIEDMCDECHVRLEKNPLRVFDCK